MILWQTRPRDHWWIRLHVHPATFLVGFLGTNDTIETIEGGTIAKHPGFRCSLYLGPFRVTYSRLVTPHLMADAERRPIGVWKLSLILLLLAACWALALSLIYAVYLVIVGLKG